MAEASVLLACLAWLGLLVWVIVDMASFAPRHWTRAGFTKRNWIALVVVTALFLMVLSPFAVILYLAWPRPRLIAVRDAQDDSHDEALRAAAREARHRQVESPSIQDIAERMRTSDWQRR